MHWIGAARGVIGAYCMAMGFIVGLLLIRLLLSPGWAILGIARTLVDEAVRMKIAMVFIVVLVLLLPMLPLTMDSNDMLKYRIQTFLSWSLMVTSVLLGLMTIFLAAGTICNELNRRQIFLTMTKPVSRVQYLLGKWLGIALLNLLLVAVCGGGIYVFTMVLTAQPAKDTYDRRAVEDEVLAARRAESPVPKDPDMLRKRFEQRVEYLRQKGVEGYGSEKDPISALPDDKRKEIQQQIIRQWYTLEPFTRTTYVFKNLKAAREIGGTVQLRINPRPNGPTNGFVRIQISANGKPLATSQPSGLQQLAVGTFHVLPIAADRIDDNGRLEVVIANPVFRSGNSVRPQPSISFNEEGGPRGALSGGLV